MIHWINSHGVEALVTYYLVISLLGTMPPVPDNATYLQRWAYAAAHALCANFKNVAANFNVTTPKENQP
jgi:hypothetical protein